MAKGLWKPTLPEMASAIGLIFLWGWRPGDSCGLGYWTHKWARWLGFYGSLHPSAPAPHRARRWGWSGMMGGRVPVYSKKGRQLVHARRDAQKRFRFGRASIWGESAWLKRGKQWFLCCCAGQSGSQTWVLHGNVGEALLGAWFPSQTTSLPASASPSNSTKPATAGSLIFRYDTPVISCCCCVPSSREVVRLLLRMYSYLTCVPVLCIYIGFLVFVCVNLLSRYFCSISTGIDCICFVYFLYCFSCACVCLVRVFLLIPRVVLCCVVLSVLCCGATRCGAVYLPLQATAVAILRVIVGGNGLLARFSYLSFSRLRKEM